MSSCYRIVEARPPVALVPVLDILSLDQIGERPPSLDTYTHLVRLDQAPCVEFLCRVVEAARPPSKARLPLDGGYALCSREEVLFTPQCCGDLGTLDEWEATLTASESGWGELWIGHPCLAYRRDGAALLLQGYVEPGEAIACPIADKPMYRLEMEALRAAIPVARSVCTALASMLVERLRDRGYPEPLDVTVARLLGSNTPTPKVSGLGE